jgi:hypothetical protein
MLTSPEISDSPKFYRIYETLKSQQRIEQVARVPSEEFFCREKFIERVAKPAYPVLMHDSRHPRTSFQQVVSSFGNTPCQVRIGDYADPKTYISDRKVVKRTLSEFLERSTTSAFGELGYAGRVQIPLDDLQQINYALPSYLDPSECEEPYSWIGPSTAVTPLHKDSSDNWVTQLIGCKSWILYPVRDIPFLSMVCPQPDIAPDFWVSQVDLRRPFLEKHADMAKAKAVTVTTSPGDTLYLPAGWAHFVVTLTYSFSVSVWRNRDMEPLMFQ